VHHGAQDLLLRGRDGGGEGRDGRAAGKGKGAQSDLKVGLRIVVNAGDGAEPLKAKEVQYTVPTTTAKQ